MSHPTHQIEAAADRIRDDLLVTLRELDRRRARATDVRLQLHQHADLVVGVAAGAAVLVGAVVTAAVLRRRNQRRHFLQRRVGAFRRAWEHPERIATRAEEYPAPLHVARKVGLAILVAFGTRLAQQAAQQVVQPAFRPLEAGNGQLH
jgi:hypothetical protein